MDRFVSKKEFDEYKRHLERRFTSSARTRTHPTSEPVEIDEEQWLSVDAWRTYRGPGDDFVTAANQTWESFMYVDVGAVFDMRIFAFSSFSWRCSDTNEVRFRLENQDDGAIRRTIKHNIVFD